MLLFNVIFRWRRTDVYSVYLRNLPGRLNTQQTEESVGSHTQVDVVIVSCEERWRASLWSRLLARSCLKDDRFTGASVTLIHIVLVCSSNCSVGNEAGLCSGLCEETQRRPWTPAGIIFPIWPGETSGSPRSSCCHGAAQFGSLRRSQSASVSLWLFSVCSSILFNKIKTLFSVSTLPHCSFFSCRHLCGVAASCSVCLLSSQLPVGVSLLCDSWF